MKRLLAACLLGSLFALAHLAGAQVTEHINFDNVPDGTLIKNTYSGYGVTFDCGWSPDQQNACLNTNPSTGYGGNVYARTPTTSVVNYTCNQGSIVTPSLAHSPNNVVSMFAPGSCPENQTFFNAQNGYLVARFPVPASSVSIWANAVLPVLDNGTDQGATFNMPYLNAYDSKGKWLATAEYSSSPLTASLGWVQLTITPSMVNNVPIGMVLFSSSFDGVGFPVWGEFDDLSFTLPSTIVPPVIGMTLANAETTITNANLTVGTISQQPSSTVPNGDIFSQNPAAGSVVVQGTAVSLGESCGAPVTVPFVVHLPANTAENDIVAAGLVVGTFTYQRSSIPIGDVISTNPAGFSVVCPGTTVNGVISSGSNPPPPPHL